MEFQALLNILKARWRLLFAVSLLIVSSTLAYRLFAAPRYIAQASVMVDPRGINPLSGAATQQPYAQNFVLGTYANIGRSEVVARRVVVQLPQEVREAQALEWRRSGDAEVAAFDTWMVAQLNQMVDIRSGGQNSNLLDITVKYKNPLHAAHIANAYAAELTRYAREMRSLPAQADAEYFRNQASNLRRQVEEAEKEVGDFRRRTGVLAANERGDPEIDKLAALNAQVVITEDQSHDTASRARQARGSNSQDVANNRLVQTLTAEVVKKEAILSELSERLGANHPNIPAAQLQVREARAALERESNRIATSLAGASSAARGRSAALIKDADKQRARVVDSNALKIQLVSLERDVEQKRKLYELSLQRSAESALEAGSQRGDLQLVHGAVPPTRPAGPGALVVVPLAVFAGLVAGVLAVLLSHRLRPKLHALTDFVDLKLCVIQTAPLLSFTDTAVIRQLQRS